MTVTLPTALWNHRHVSERETAHRWPDGRLDNAAWEDCFWDTLVEFVRMTLRPNVPATHAEAEALRAASGEDTGSGSNSRDGNKGLRARYGLGPLPTRSDADVLAMLPGFAAHVSGSMGAFPAGHGLLRWAGDFRGFHRVSVFRVDGGTGWWWCDPLAPASYQGEPIGRSELARFMAAHPSDDHFILPLLPKPPTPVAPTPSSTQPQEEGVIVVTIDRFLVPRKFVAKTNLRRFSATAELSSIPVPYEATVDATVAIESKGVPHGSGFLRLASGGSAGKYILAAQVELT